MAPQPLASGHRQRVLEAAAGAVAAGAGALEVGARPLLPAPACRRARGPAGTAAIYGWCVVAEVRQRCCGRAAAHGHNAHAQFLAATARLSVGVLPAIGPPPVPVALWRWRDC